MTHDQINEFKALALNMRKAGLIKIRSQIVLPSKGPSKVSWSWIARRLGISPACAHYAGTGKRPSSIHRESVKAYLDKFGTPKKRNRR